MIWLWGSKGAKGAMKPVTNPPNPSELDIYRTYETLKN